MKHLTAWLPAVIIVAQWFGSLDIALAAPDAPSTSWRQIKCSRYSRAWSDAIAHLGSTGLGQDFLTRHQAFLDSGCTRKADVCPRSDQELKLANIMVVLAMNAGTASTFPPFACHP